MIKVGLMPYSESRVCNAVKMDVMEDGEGMVLLLLYMALTVGDGPAVSLKGLASMFVAGVDRKRELKDLIAEDLSPMLGTGEVGRESGSR